MYIPVYGFIFPVSAMSKAGEYMCENIMCESVSLMKAWLLELSGFYSVSLHFQAI